MQIRIRIEECIRPTMKPCAGQHRSVSFHVLQRGLQQGLQSTIRGVRTLLRSSVLSHHHSPRHSFVTTRSMASGGYRVNVGMTFRWRSAVSVGFGLSGNSPRGCHAGHRGRLVGVGSGGGFQSVPSRSIAQQRTSRRRATATIACLRRVFWPRDSRCSSCAAHGL